MKFSSALVLFGACCASAQTIVEVVVGSDVHNTLEAAVLAANPVVADVLASGEDLTLFAPDDTAFEAVDQDYLALLLTEPWELHLFCFLTAHVLDSVVPSGAITESVTVETFYDDFFITADRDGDTVTINGIPVTGADIMADNGVIHVLSDSPILPPCVTSNIPTMLTDLGNFTTLLGLVEAAGLVDAVTDTLGFTLFAPTDEAFAEVPQDILDFLGSDIAALTDVLLYHALEGTNVIIEAGGDFTTLLVGQSVTVTVEDTSTFVNGIIVDDSYVAQNGLIYSLDSVLLPPGFSLPEPTTPPPVSEAPVTMAPVTMAPVTMAPLPSLLDIVVASEMHTTLETAASASQPVLDLLSDPTADVTLFAPDDTAFMAVPSETLQQLLTEPWSNHLLCFLAHHVIGGVAQASDIIGTEASITSFSTEDLLIVGNDTGVFVDNIPVTTPDIMASNGIIHVISEAPLLPSCVSSNIVELGVADENFSTVVGLVVDAGLADTLATTSPLTLFAPSNDAFTKVPSEILEYLAGNVTALTEVLTYHVVPDLFFAGVDTTLSTLNGDDIAVAISGETITLNDNVDAQGPSLASNGVVYAIDTVLIPPSLFLPDFGTDSPVAAPTNSPTSSASGIFGSTLFGLASLTILLVI